MSAKKEKGERPAPSDDGLTQSERFIKAAQELGTDDDPERFAERVRKLAKLPSEVSTANPDRTTKRTERPE